MRIDKLEIQNFKKFVDQTFEFHPYFTLLVGDNGAGKTSVLDALAVAMGLWHRYIRGASGWRNILTEEIRLAPKQAGDRITLERQYPSKISAIGQIGGKVIEWARMIKEGGTRTTNVEAQHAAVLIWNIVKVPEDHSNPWPLLSYYGAGRAWAATNKRPYAAPSQKPVSRFDAYYSSLDTRIREKELNDWFLFETIAVNGQAIGGRPGFQALKTAVLQCIPDSDEVRYDADLKQIVLSIKGQVQPFYNLSAGQRMMLSMVGDIAKKAVTLNSYLLGPGQPGESDPMQVLYMTPGIVLIDELDIHLHPKWQRRVATDLKRTFPAIQFVCTSHSPQVIGEVPKEEIRILEDDSITTPDYSLGLDSNRILEELMDSTSKNDHSEKDIHELSKMIDNEKLEEAKQKIAELEKTLGPNDPDLIRSRTLISFLEQPE